MSKNLINSGWKQFLALCMKAKDEEQLNELFELFLTPEEKEHLALRYLIVAELLEGKKTQRDLARDLKISIAKITRGSNNIKRLSNKMKQFLTQAFARSA